MKLEVKRNTLVIIPESDADKAFLEDTLGFKTLGTQKMIERIDNISMGFIQSEYALKILN